MIDIEIKLEAGNVIMIKRSFLSSNLSTVMPSFDLFNGFNEKNYIRKSIETIITRANNRNEISLSLNTISEKALNLPSLLIINDIILYGSLRKRVLRILLIIFCFLCKEHSMWIFCLNANYRKTTYYLGS